jgi:hypothetical protein
LGENRRPEGVFSAAAPLCGLFDPQISRLAAQSLAEFDLAQAHRVEHSVVHDANALAAHLSCSECHWHHSQIALHQHRKRRLCVAPSAARKLCRITMNPSLPAAVSACQPSSHPIPSLAHPSTPNPSAAVRGISPLSHHAAVARKWGRPACFVLPPALRPSCPPSHRTRRALTASGPALVSKVSFRRQCSSRLGEPGAWPGFVPCAPLLHDCAARIQASKPNCGTPVAARPPSNMSA